jgi:hypothetical protein
MSTTPSPINSASGLLNTLTPNPPNRPSILPMLICRTTFGLGLGAPDCLSIEDVLPPLEALVAKTSGESHKRGLLSCRSSTGVLRMRGVDIMRLRRRPGRRNDIVRVGGFAGD